MHVHVRACVCVCVCLCVCFICRHLLQPPLSRLTLRMIDGLVFVALSTEFCQLLPLKKKKHASISFFLHLICQRNNNLIGLSLFFFFLECVIKRNKPIGINIDIIISNIYYFLSKCLPLTPLRNAKHHDYITTILVRLMNYNS